MIYQKSICGSHSVTGTWYECVHPKSSRRNRLSRLELQKCAKRRYAMSLQAHLFDLNVAMRILYLHTAQTLKTKPFFPRVMVFVSLEVAFTFYSVMEFDSFKTFDFLMFDMTTCYGRVNDFQGVPFMYLICFSDAFLTSITLEFFKLVTPRHDSSKSYDAR